MVDLFLVNGKTAVVTGGSRGIGREIVLKMADAGVNVAIIYAGNEAAAEETVKLASEKNVKAISYKCNVASFSEVMAVMNQIISDFGGIDILVNNAGITKDNLILKMSEEDFDAVIDTNLKGAFNTIKSVYSHMAKRRSGRIINISSVSGLFGTAGQANYVSSKAGMIGLTKTVARELGARGITCNAIAPGYIETDMTAALDDKLKQNYLEKIPAKHFGKTEDIANAVLFLSSQMAGYITGEVIRVDGGLCM